MTPPDARVIAVIPVFSAPPELAERVRGLLGQVERVVLVDDGTFSLGGTELDGLDRVDVVELDENRGIAHALNVGVGVAREAGADAVLTLDQDSAAPDGYVADAMAAIAADRGRGRNPGFAVPASAGGNAILRTRSRRGGTAEAFDPIQSGAVVPIEVFDELGGFAEQLFIDAVDSDFTLRALRAGYSIAVVEGADIGHSLGELVPIMIAGRHLTVGGKPRHVLYHAPFRTYYMVRNSIYLMQEHRKGFLRWHAVRWFKMGSMIVALIVLGDGRMPQLRAVRYGARDGFRRRFGRIPPETLAKITGGRR